MKTKIKPSILSGFMELLPREQEKFNDILEKITNVYEKNGCLPIDTPIIEKAEVLLAKSGGETEKQVYSFSKGKNNLALRFDLTVPFARYAAQYYNELIFPFKRYQIGKVYRGERNQKGRYREFYQCDVDIIGKDELSIKNDAWIINLVSKSLKAIGLNGYKIQISNRKILKGLLAELSIKSSKEVMILIDKYDKIGKEAFVDELNVLVGEDKSKFIKSILDMGLEDLEKLTINNEDFKKGIENLKEVKSMLKVFGVKENEYEINLKIIRGLDYYTGMVFETILEGNESYGSICSGGRYDNLAENYTDNILPGVGMSIGLTRLFFTLQEIGFIDNYKISNKFKYLILPIGGTLEYCGLIIRRLEEKGVDYSIYLENSTLKKKMNYANKLGFENVILVGEDERENNELIIKKMTTGEEHKIDIKAL
ncbi:histidine--tRNA ligase [Clostridium intestinale]|uniref:Histidine--tRNA ligase n=1 Tax=Clostridium intestinale TaxID=36845 RepID=A0A7D6ZV85_9CLOT|nr:histidine--tRNA ligase [Clostridium intestinale]QLY78254.1 histidine--tRNA ligase [Clostridium intestinale]